MGVLLLLLLRLLCAVLAAAEVVVVRSLKAVADAAVVVIAVWTSSVLPAKHLCDALSSGVSLACALAVDSALTVVAAAVVVVVTTVCGALTAFVDVVVVICAVFIVVVAGVAFGGVGCVLLRQLLSLYIYKPKSRKIVSAIKSVKSLSE